MTKPEDNQSLEQNLRPHAIDNGQAADTPVNLNQETKSVSNPAPAFGAEQQEGLPPDLSAEEQVRAAQALEFLNEVRTASLPSNQLPQSMGRFQILRSLGRGGFAEVFLAYDPELDRQVALKVPLFNTTISEEAGQRFEREARLAASLAHPQIIPVYEYGMIGPLRFIAFAVCDGPALSDWSEQDRPLDARTAAEIIASLADAVQHAHQRGIVHRDLKPGNVLVETNREDDLPVWQRVRITDFGLARTYDDQATLLTQGDRIVGTPAYMSPEQASSQSDVGPAADIWALGMMLFELLTDQLPFRRDDLLATARAITDDAVPKVRSVRADVSQGLEAIVDLCLRKSPSDRYSSAHELAEDLRRWLQGKPVTARPLSALTTSFMWIKRNPVVAGSIGLTIAALAIGLSVALWQRNQALANLREAQTQTSRADDNLLTAQKLIDEIIALEESLRSQSELSEQRASLLRRAADLQLQLVKDEKQTPKIRYDTAKSLRELVILQAELQQPKSSSQYAKQILALLQNLEKNLPDGVTQNELYEFRLQQMIRIVSNAQIAGFADDERQYQKAADELPIPEGYPPLRRAVWLSEIRRSRSMGRQMQGDPAGSAAELKLALSYFDGLETPTNDRLRWNYFLTLSRLKMGLGMDELALNDLQRAKTLFADAASGFAELSKLFPDHPRLQVELMILNMQRGELAERCQEWQAAGEYYRSVRTAAKRQFDQQPEDGNAANFYVLGSVALCRSLKQNDDTTQASQIAATSLKVAGDFPEHVRKTQSYLINAELLNTYLPLP